MNKNIIINLLLFFIIITQIQNCSNFLHRQITEKKIDLIQLQLQKIDSTIQELKHIKLIINEL